MLTYAIRKSKIGFRVYKFRDQISLICLVIKDLVFIFDLLAIRKQSQSNEVSFLERVKLILENQSVKKIVYDSNLIQESLDCQIKNFVDLDVIFFKKI